jgi:hypothetical protein
LRPSSAVLVRGITALGYGLAFAVSACGAPPEADSTADAAPSEPPARQHSAACVAPAGISNAPRTISDTLTLINALPKPLTLPCFLEALARPLEINATNSLFSAQPSQGQRSPRIFLFRDPNTMSIVPAGPGAPLLEFGEQRPDYRSLKAELEFPVLGPLLPSAPFERLLFSPQITTCGVCHAAEVQESMVFGVPEFVSASLRPLPDDNVPAAALLNELAICDRTAEPDRCALLDGLLGWGPVTDRAFPPQMATFGGG